MIHSKLQTFSQWIDVDITNSPVKKNIKSIIENDMTKSSPNILQSVNNGTYSPYRPYLSALGNTSLDILHQEYSLSQTAYVLLAAVKFKNLLKKVKKD